MALYHFHASVVARGKGHSAVAAAAYQAREQLTHQQQNIGSYKVDWDNDTERKQFSADKRGLTKGEVSGNLRRKFRESGISLSDSATAQKDRRDYWTVSDNGNVYTVHAFRETSWAENDDGTKWISPDTGKGKRIVTGQGLDIYQDRTHNYGTKEDLRDKWIDPPDRNPAWLNETAAKQDRQTYWNKTESAENRRDSVSAFRIEVALQREMTEQQRKESLREWIRQEFTSKGAVCDVAIHQTTADDGGINPHAHILISTRIANETGFEDTKNPAFVALEETLQENEAKRLEKLERLRKSWADVQNKHLEQAGHDVRIDHRTLEEQDTNRKPQLHMGQKAWNAEKNGYQTKRGDRNEWRKEQNRQKEDARERAQKKPLPKQEKPGWWGRITRIIPRHKPIERKPVSRNDRKRFLLRQWRWQSTFNAATEHLRRIRKTTPEPSPEAKQVTKEEINRHISKEYAKHMPKRSHVERAKHKPEGHHGIKR